MGKIKRVANSMPAPARRGIAARALHRMSGAGGHKNKKQSQNEKEETMMTLREFRDVHSIYSGSDMADAVNGWKNDEKVPALCHDGCEVNHDENCEHGNPSILLVLNR